MASLPCWRCLRPASTLQTAPRIAARVGATKTHTSHFSTTPISLKQEWGVVTKKQKGVHQITGKHKQVNKNKSKARAPLGNRPLPGERKAWRKRIILSNNNALPVDLDAVNDKEALSDPKNVGKMMALAPKVISRLRAAEAFKTTQSWSMFYQPAMLIREETVELMKKMTQAVEEKKWLKMVISGGSKTGKSTLMLQALYYGLLNDWIVMHIPDAQQLVISHTDYHSIEAGTLWGQATYAQKLCRQLMSNNDLHHLKPTKVHEALGTHQARKKNLSLHDICHMSRDPDDAWAAWEAVWYELTQVPGRPPILFTVDGLQHIMRVSDYRDKKYEFIHSHDLSLIRGFCDLMAGRLAPTGGGIVMGALTGGNFPALKSVEYWVGRKEAELVDKLPEEEWPQREPYCRTYDERVDEVLKGVDVLRVPGIDKVGTRSVVEYWAASGMFRHAVTDKLITEVWSMGGHGVLGEMERATLRNARMQAVGVV